MKKNKNPVQLIWGIALMIAGIGVFYRLPQVWPDIKKIEYFQPVLPFIRVCFYLIGIMLIGGGFKKIYENFKSVNNNDLEK
jgi:hypothetical protein